MSDVTVDLGVSSDDDDNKVDEVDGFRWECRFKEEVDEGMKEGSKKIPVDDAELWARLLDKYGLLIPRWLERYFSRGEIGKSGEGSMIPSRLPWKSERGIG